MIRIDTMFTEVNTNDEIPRLIKYKRLYHAMVFKTFYIYQRDRDFYLDHIKSIIDLTMQEHNLGFGSYVLYSYTIKDIHHYSPEPPERSLCIIALYIHKEGHRHKPMDTWLRERIEKGVPVLQLAVLQREIPESVKRSSGLILFSPDEPFSLPDIPVVPQNLTNEHLRVKKNKPPVHHIKDTRFKSVEL